MPKLQAFICCALLVMLVGYSPKALSQCTPSQTTSSCNGDCNQGMIYLQNTTVNGQRFVTAKSASSGEIIAGDSVTLCTSNGHVLLDVDADVDLRAGRRVQLEPGFRALKGAYLDAYIVPCWTMIEHDEFDNQGHFDSLWSKGYKSIGDSNATIEDSSFAYLSGGKLVLKGDTVRNGATLEYHAAAVGTGSWLDGYKKVGFAHGYGRYEFSEEIPTNPGLWTNSWLWPIEDVKVSATPSMTTRYICPGLGSCKCGGKDCDDRAGADEFDVNERAWIWQHCDNWLQPNYHGQKNCCIDGRSNRDQAWPKSFYADDSSSIDTNYHQYALEWLPGAFRWLMDSCVIYRVVWAKQSWNDSIVNLPRRIIKEYNGNPQQEVTRLQLWYSFYDSLPPGMTFPVYHRYDYVRWYDLVSPCDTSGGGKRAVGDEHIGSSQRLGSNLTTTIIPSGGRISVKIDLAGIAAQGGVVRVELCDLSGRIVAKALEQEVDASTPTLQVPLPRDLPSGTYFCVTSVWTPSQSYRDARQVNLVR